MSSQISSSAGNKDLIDVIRCHLLDEFMKHGRDKERRGRRGGDRPLPEYCDPWWWPLDPARELNHWGLSPGDEAIFRSLRPVEPGKSYSNFLGSLGAEAGCVFIIGERPSFCENYGRYIWKLDKLLNLLRRNLPELGDFHVTDCIKFRGTHLGDKLSQEMIDISRRCLSAEFDLLNPKMVLLTCMAGEEMLKFLSLQPRYLQRSFVVVPHWCKNDAEHEWVPRVRKAVRRT